MTLLQSSSIFFNLLLVLFLSLSLVLLLLHFSTSPLILLLLLDIAAETCATNTPLLIGFQKKAEANCKLAVEMTEDATQRLFDTLSALLLSTSST